jgi:polysaccharide chain length determinant protein (PEP-CTERM system associated)
MVPQQGYAGVSRRPPDIEDYIDILRRYRSWIIGPTFAGVVIAVVAGFLWPDTFVSTAVMRITPQQVPQSLVPSNISTQISERLTAMQQEILSRTSLQELIQRPSLNLYPKERQSQPMEDVIERMRKAVKITLMEPAGNQSQQQRFASAFQINFSYPDKYKAQAVVRELVTKFIEQNVNVLRNQSNMTTSFLTDELKSAKENLDRLDAEMTKFKMANAGRLPEQLQANLQAVNTLELQLSTINEGINRTAQEKMMLETQLQNLKTQINFIASSADDSAPGQTVKNDRLIQLNRVILDNETRLSALRLTYKEDHPDIRSLEAQLAVLKKERDRLEKEGSQAVAAKSGESKKMSLQVAQSLENIKMAIASTQAQIQSRNLELEEKVRRQKQLQAEIMGYRARIEASPINEQRYAALQRDYQLAKQNYDEMSRKKEISETASNLEERKAGENLEVLDPASLPEQPSEPNRLMIAGAGLGLGLCLGVFLAGVKEMKDTSLKNLKDVRAYTNLPVLSSIPLLENALLVRRKRRLFWLAWSTAVIIGTIAMTGSMYYYYFGKS